ncbi:NACHT, LRR and PYD domains-containing protein 1b allele 3-like isoform X2 [Pantherophis guttatus]|uniref:NACHT, LRR and PYD domains-containing protein 1b allele 3-like isoform X2 n=1 Tax=Pantherophis guttatus TaxID=94885 RepID=A0ABM3YSC6_PANGU|nr:NACHT, LRR and PYD domains-containing protein 1b allele 3-like isoform X2 [Pantherophis guttatus]
MASKQERGQVQGSESDGTSEDDKGNDSSSSDSESSESETETNGTNENEPLEEPEEKELQLYCSKSVEQEGEELQNGGESVNIQQCCKHCIIQKKQHEQVTPRRFLKGQFCLKLDGEGTFECTATGLIFEVTRSVTIEYSVLSWTKYAAYVKEPWIVVGPIFDIKCSSSALTSIQFPHTLCLNDHLSEKAFKVFHFKKNGPEFEGSIDHSTTHVKWHVSSLSPVGPVIERYDPVYYHGVVILYKVINNHPSLKFRVYIATNNNSFIKDISKTVRRSLNKFIKIEKPPCHKLLQNGKKYRLTSDPEADITPEEIQFGDDSTLAEKPFFEVYLEQPMELMLSLVDLESEEVVWKAKLRESDWTLHNQNENEQEKSLNCVGKRKATTKLKNELCCKRQKIADITDGTNSNPLLTDYELMSLAKKMGKDWKVIGIGCLKLTLQDIEQIEAKEEDVNMYKCMMLRKWRDSEQNNGTAHNLYKCLDGQVSHELLELLKGFLQQT